jgi:hypothetical protein
MDLINGSGKEQGYFMITSANGDRSCGKYQGQISSANGTLSAEGTWEFTHGAGECAGITGNGKYKARMISPTETETSFEGSYQFKAGTRAA